MLHSGGQNQQWPTNGQFGCITPAVSGVPNALERGTKLAVAKQVGKLAKYTLSSQGSPML